MSDQKRQVVDLLKSIETGDPKPAGSRQPRASTPSTTSPSPTASRLRRGCCRHSRRARRKVNTVRVFQDGDFVFAHTDYDFFGPKIGFDIFRFEDGKIVEHWDNLQEKPRAPNPSGHTMTDGPTEATDLDQTEANKALVRQLRRRHPRQRPDGQARRLLRRRQLRPAQPADRRRPLGPGHGARGDGEGGHHDEVRPRPPGAGRGQLRARRQRGAASAASTRPSTTCSASRTARSPSTGTRSRRSRRGTSGRTRTGSSGSNSPPRGQHIPVVLPGPSRLRPGATLHGGRVLIPEPMESG